VHIDLGVLKAACLFNGLNFGSLCDGSDGVSEMVSEVIINAYSGISISASEERDCALLFCTIHLVS
jgi:hypothetical protein